MTQFEIHDPNGRVRSVISSASPDKMRILLTIFKTHCVTEGSAYEFNHFMNWLKKHYGVLVSFVPDDPVRIDM